MATTAAVLVVSCDRYEFAWDPFFALFDRYWADCPWPVYLVTDTKTYEHPGVVTIQAGLDRGWSSRTKAALRQIDADIVLVLLEDYLLCAHVDTQWLQNLIGPMRALGAGHVRVYPCQGPDKDLRDWPGLGLISPGASYRASLQPAFWTCQVLDRLLVEGETAWDVEFLGSERSNELSEPFLSIVRPVDMKEGPLPLRYVHGIQQGKWWPAAVRFLRREGIEVDARWTRRYTFIDRWRARLQHEVRYGALGRQIPVRALMYVLRRVMSR